MLCRWWRGLRLGLLQGKIATLNSYLASSTYGATICDKDTIPPYSTSEFYYNTHTSVPEKPMNFPTILSRDTGVWPALAQLADTGGAAAAGDGGPAPAALLLPKSRSAHRDMRSTRNTAGQAGNASSTAAGHSHLCRARLLDVGLSGKEQVGRGKDKMGSKIT